MSPEKLEIQEQSKQGILERGWWQYGEDLVMVQQNPYIKEFFTELLNTERPTLIIEIGTSFAGLTIILSDIIKELDLNSQLISYDNATRQYISELADKYGFDYREKTVGEISTDTEISSLISKTDGKVLVLCDGGSKIYEFNTFAKALKPGDMIGAHDYADDIDDFNSRVVGKVWSWFEIQLAYIQNTIEIENLVDLDNNLSTHSKNVAWILKKKA